MSLSWRKGREYDDGSVAREMESDQNTGRRGGLRTRSHSQSKGIKYSYNHPALRSNVRVCIVSGFISPFNGAKCFLMREPIRNITG